MITVHLSLQFTVSESHCVCVLISVKVRNPAIHVLNNSPIAPVNRIKMLVCIETVLVLTSIYIMQNTFTDTLLVMFHFDLVLVQVQIRKEKNSC